MEKTEIFLITLLFSLSVLAIDFFTGPLIRFSVVFMLPIIVCAWFCGPFKSIIIAVTMPLANLILLLNQPKPWSFNESIINTAITILTLSLIAYLISYVRMQQDRINLLQGILPICSFCKKIRNAENNWEQLEKYITEFSQAKFSHGVCPECAEIHYGIKIDKSVKTTK
jgi:hypothetical protein